MSDVVTFPVAVGEGDDLDDDEEEDPEEAGWTASSTKSQSTIVPLFPSSEHAMVPSGVIVVVGVRPSSDSQ